MNNEENKTRVEPNDLLNNSTCTNNCQKLRATRLNKKSAHQNVFVYLSEKFFELCNLFCGFGKKPPQFKSQTPNLNL